MQEERTKIQEMLSKLKDADHQNKEKIIYTKQDGTVVELNIKNSSQPPDIDLWLYSY